MNNDKRNVIDKYKGAPIDDIVRDLDARAHTLEIAVDNVERDFNMGTIVRSANAFGVRRVHIIGRRQSRRYCFLELNIQVSARSFSRERKRSPQSSNSARPAPSTSAWRLASLCTSGFAAVSLI